MQKQYGVTVSCFNYYVLYEMNCKASAPKLMWYNTGENSRLYKGYIFLECDANIAIFLLSLILNWVLEDEEPLHESILWFIKNSLIIVTKVDCCHSFQDLIKLCPKVVQFHSRQSWGRKRENENLFNQFIQVKFYLKIIE